QYGYRMFECDAKLSRDGVPFLLHDSTLERTTDGTGTAGDVDFADLARRDAGSWHSRAWVGEPLPTLAAAARYCMANHFFLNIEIKPTPGQELETGRVVAAQAAQLWAGAGVPPLLSSFRPESLTGARESAPQLPRALLLDSLWEGHLESAQQLGCAALVCKYTLWTAALVARAHQLGMRALSYTVDDPDAAQALLALGTDGIITNRVDLFSPAAEFTS
ncbi:MAG: glycerophosphodiester phosphodiesterase family protein, partial [Giesbergeria sp.]